jgi:hypothetical protein
MSSAINVPKKKPVTFRKRHLLFSACSLCVLPSSAKLVYHDWLLFAQAYPRMSRWHCRALRRNSQTAAQKVRVDACVPQGY